jgi:hypothetical protein
MRILRDGCSRLPRGTVAQLSEAPDLIAGELLGSQATKVLGLDSRL